MKRIYADNELERAATIKQYLTVQTEGDREVQRKVDHYSLQAIIAVGTMRSHNEDAVATDANPNWRACADLGFRHE